jgi:enhancing lycopene biosynthesis protein 2
MSKKIGVILSGAGYLDGSEIYEAVTLLLALDRAGAEAVCMAPDIPLHHVVNHLTGKPTQETRTVLLEAARIVRGKIADIRTIQTAYLDAVILPGGFGAAKNLSSYATKGAKCEVIPEVTRVIKETILREKPLGAICIAPVLVAKVLGAKKMKATLTIGNDKKTAADIEKMGCIHKPCTVTDIVVDAKYKIVTTPAYMYPVRISEAAEGISKLVQQIISMI